MAWQSNMVSMELDDEDKLDTIQPYPMPTKPDFPYGLKISLTEKELEKLKLEADCGIGDSIDFMCHGVVTCVSKNDTCRWPVLSRGNSNRGHVCRERVRRMTSTHFE